MGLFFKFMIVFLDSKLTYEQSFKSIYLTGSVILALVFYLLIAFFIKAFKISDIKLKY